MGGSGSGRWYRWQSAKTTVEESLSIAITTFRGRLIDGSAGTLHWGFGESQKSVKYSVSVEWDEPTITLSYRRGDLGEVSLRVGTEISLPNFGGQRWWFTCPLSVNGRVCQRRVGKLYLRPGSKFFGCRKCHQLSYRSSQEAHKAVRVFSRWGLARDEAYLLGSFFRTGPAFSRAHNRGRIGQ
jgi:hypothetical protein